MGENKKLVLKVDWIGWVLEFLFSSDCPVLKNLYSLDLIYEQKLNDLTGLFGDGKYVHQSI